MATFLGTAHRLETSLRVDPRLIVAARVMEMTALELDAAIDLEVAENPALERLEEDEAPTPPQLTFESGDREYQRSTPNDDVAPDPTERVAAPAWTRDVVRVQLDRLLPPHLWALGDYIIEALDARGYLRDSDEEICLATGATLEEVAFVITALQACEPPGVGARNVRDGLRLMLLREATPAARLAERMLADALEDLIARRTGRLARRFGVTREQVEQAYAALLAQDPSPFGDEGLPPSRPAEADMALVRNESGWTVEVLGPGPNCVGLSRSYLKCRKKLANDTHASPDERRHVEGYIDRAERFVSALESRRDTLRRLGEALLQTQGGYVTTGDLRFLRPLTRTALAQLIGVHESTLSRATAEKFVRLGTGEVIPFAVFFTPALRIQRMIDEIVALENPAHPLSDERIRQLLAEKGVHVARRTVNKYRSKGRTLSSRARRDGLT